MKLEVTRTEIIAEQERVGEQLTFDFELLKQGENPEVNCITKMLSLRTPLADGTESIGEIHLLGNSEADIKPLPYDDDLGPAQIELSEQIKPGDFVIGIKHHLFNQDLEDKELVKLQCTHIQNIVGIDTGVISINNPRNYQGGLFGDRSYPMTFIKPKINLDIPDSIKKSYMDNARSWLIIANCFTEFPSDYNGGDPLSAYSLTKIKEFGNKLLEALTGDELAKKWLNLDENKIYCAELGFLSLNLGLYFPLNEKNIGELKFGLVKSLLESRTFVESNTNKYAKLVNLCLAPENLPPLDHLGEFKEENKGEFWEGLAIKPLKIDDMILNFIRYSVDRERVGELKGSRIQVELFRKIRPSLIEMAASNGNAQALNVFFSQIEEALSKVHETYESFLTSIKDELAKGSQIGDVIDKKFIPPHAFLIRAYESIVKKENTGPISWEYIGHGIHKSYFKGVSS